MAPPGALSEAPSIRDRGDADGMARFDGAGLEPPGAAGGPVTGSSEAGFGSEDRRWPADLAAGRGARRAQLRQKPDLSSDNRLGGAFADAIIPAPEAAGPCRLDLTWRPRRCGFWSREGDIMRRRHAATTLGAVLLAAATGGPASAQVVTDGSLGSGPGMRLEVGAGGVISIREDIGRRVGDSLFHSFSEFSVRQGETAAFTGEAGIERVISRVTGGRPSEIDGGIEVAIPNADFYFVNPAGIRFGQGATLTLSGGTASFAAADRIEFADGAVFSATDLPGSSLTVAPPRAFGFLDATPGRLTVDGAELVPTNFGGRAEGLMLSGRDIEISGRGRPGEGNVFNGPLGLDDQGGTVAVVAGGPAAQVPTFGADPVGAAPAEGSVRIDEFASVFADSTGAGPAGRTVVAAATLALAEGARISSSGFFEAGGGAVEIYAGALTMTGGSAILADGGARGGAGGTVSVQAGEMELSGILFPSIGEGATRLSAEAFAGEAFGGVVSVQADTLALSELAEINVSSPDYVAGIVDLSAEVLTLSSGARIVANSDFAAGDIRLSGGSLSATGAAPIGLFGLRRSGLSARGGEGGLGGFVGIDLDGPITLSDRASIDIRGIDSDFTIDGVPRARVTIAAPSLSLSGGAGILADTDAPGRAGTVLFSGGLLEISDLRDPAEIGLPSAISASADGAGTDGGRIRLEAGTLRLEGRAALLANGATAGAIEIEADRVEAIGPGLAPDDGVFVSVTGEAAPDAGFGRLTVTATQSVTLANTALFVGLGGGAGAVGTLSVSAPEIALRDLSNVGATNTGAAGPGTVAVTGHRIALVDSAIFSVADRRPSSGIALRAEERLTIGGSGQITAISGLGGGEIDIRTPDLRMAGAASIGNPVEASPALGAIGEGGSSGLIRISEATAIALAETARITSNAFADGAAGAIVLDTARLSLADRATIAAATTTSGAAGDIRIVARESVELTGAARILTSVAFVPGLSPEAGLGGGGDIAIETGTLSLSGPLAEADPDLSPEARAPLVSARSDSPFEGSGAAGSVSVLADRVDLRSGARITVDADVAPGGSVRLGAPEAPAGTILLRRAEVVADVNRATTAAAGAPDGGNVTMIGDLIAIDAESGVTARAVVGDGGVLDFRGGLVLVPDPGVLDVESQQGESGEIRIEGLEETAAALARIEPGLFDPRELLGDPCAAAASGRSSLVLAGAGGARVAREAGPALYLEAVPYPHEGPGSETSARAHGGRQPLAPASAADCAPAPGPDPTE